MSVHVRGWSFVAAVWLGTSVAAAADPDSFEEVARHAEAAPELAALVAPYLDDCARARREIDRARCRGVQSFVRDKLPDQLYSQVIDSPNVVSVSGYDANIKGFRFKLMGCLTCEKPVLGPAGEKRFVTLKVPNQHAANLGAAAALADSTVSFDSVPEARAWEASVKPRLRAEVVFKPTGKAWTFRQHRGLAFTPVATRVFDRCTGEVVFSSPRSMAKVEVQEGLDGCGPAPGETASKAAKDGEKIGKEGDDGRPEKLGAIEIAAALKPANAELRACDAKYKMRGQVDLDFEVPGHGGSAQTVRARGNLGGTEVADCLLQAVRKVKFPQFQRASQNFSFSVRLQGQ